MTTGEHFRDTLEAHNLLHRHQALVRVLSEVPRGRVHSLTFPIDDGYCTRSFSMSTKTFDKQDYLFIRTKIPTCFPAIPVYFFISSPSRRRMASAMLKGSSATD